MLAKLKLTPKAFKALRSRVYRAVLVMVLPLLAFNEKALGHDVDTHLAGHLPGWLAYPGGAAIIAAVVAFVGGKFGLDPNSTLLDGIFGKTPAITSTQPIETAGDPVTPRPGVFSTEPPTTAAPKPDPPVFTSHADQLDHQATMIYGGAAPIEGVELVDDEPTDPQAPHGFNDLDETEPEGSAPVVNLGATR